nr:MAG TPA: hypothetical protein [Caudoviricetes sp.]
MSLTPTRHQTRLSAGFFMSEILRATLGAIQPQSLSGVSHRERSV